MKIGRIYREIADWWIRLRENSERAVWKIREERINKRDTSERVKRRYGGIDQFRRQKINVWNFFCFFFNHSGQLAKNLNFQKICFLVCRKAKLFEILICCWKTMNSSPALWIMRYTIPYWADTHKCLYLAIYNTVYRCWFSLKTKIITFR